MVFTRAAIHMLLACAALSAAAEAPAPVTARSLLENERFWPHQVALTEAVRPDGRDRALGAGTRGVLIRVEAAGVARIDFGRDGRAEVPIAKTDVVERANRIRRGELHKMAPNFVLSIAPQLVDPRAGEVRPFPMQRTREQRGFLCVFAATDSDDFGEMAEVLGSAAAHREVLPILLPQDDAAPAHLLARLRSLSWPAPFVYPRVAGGYTRALLDASAPRPYLMLVTPEGRVLFEAPWEPGVASRLRAAIQTSLDGVPPDATTGGES